MNTPKIPQDYSGVIRGRDENPQIAGVASAVDLPMTAKSNPRLSQIVCG